jgi:two-component system, sensor histidine kinase and response regulator
MNTPAETDVERLRLQSLLDAKILDTPAEEDFDDLTRLSAAICKAPTSLISLVDDKRQWFKSKYGLDTCETPRGQAFCAYAIQNPTEPFIIENALEDPRFIYNPLVTGEPHIRFYAGFPIVDAQGYALGSLCVIDYVPRHLDKSQIDALKILSKQVAAQIELRKASRRHAIASHRYRQILEQAADGIYIYDLNGQINGANRKFCEIVGYTEAEVLQMSIYDFFTAEDAETLKIGFGKLVNGKTLTNELTVVRPDKTVVPIELSEKLIDENTLQGIMRDISQRKKAEAELSETRQLFSLFINHSPTMIYMKDEAGRFVFANDLLERSFNVHESEILGKTNDTFVPEELAERVRRTDNIVLQTGQATQTVEVVQMAGKMRHWLSHKFLVKNKKGEKFIGAIAIDITDRHEMEVELKAARDAALESDKLKSAFLANISHEIRTPMNGVIGMTDLLLNTSLNNLQQEYVDTIRHSSESLLAIINDILDLSKIESGKMRFNRTDFDVREVVESTAESFTQRARHKNIEIVTLIESETPQKINGDPGRLRQVLVNLIGNAVKFTETGEIKINVKIEDSDDEITTLKFSVADTGIGISRENVKILFQPFMQVDNSHTRQFGGTGLGLTISKQIVEMMGGEISVESEPEKGSVFSFTAKFNNALPISEPQAGISSEERFDSLKDRKILIVDANEIIRQTFDFHTSSWNMKPAEATNGAQCLEKLREAANNGEPFDFVLIDTHLVDFDSFALCKMIKNDSQLTSVEIILTTAHGQRGDADEAQRLRVAAYLSKPLLGTQLLECLLVVLKNQNERAERRLITRHSLNETKVEPDAAISQIKEGKLSVLVVEDNEINRRIVLAQLKRNGIDADFAVDGVEALEKIERSAYQLVLMDCQMPRLDGYQATEEIRRIEKHKREDGEEFVPLVIIALTAHTLDGEREKCLAVGMNDYISKPFNSANLLALIDQWRGEIYDNSGSLMNDDAFLNDSSELVGHTK